MYTWIQNNPVNSVMDFKILISILKCYDRISNRTCSKNIIVEILSCEMWALESIPVFNELRKQNNIQN